MTKTFCDVCKKEMRQNFANTPIRLNRYDKEALLNINANVMVSLEREGSHVCQDCALKVIREGELMAPRA